MTNQTKKKILIAEDDESLLSVLSDNFAIAGFTVLGASNGQEALDLALKEHPDIILLDIQMPVMDGLEALNKLRRDEWGKLAEVMLLTNFGDFERVAKAAEEGAYEYLIKSDWKTKDIVNKVKNKLGIV